MKLAGRIPVEPLDDERMTSIERRVVAGAVDAAAHGRERRAPSGHARRALAAAVMVFAGFVGWALHDAADRQRVVSEPRPVHVETGRQHSTIVVDGAKIESDGGTVVHVTQPGGGVLVTMQRGKVELAVDKRGARPPVIVRAGDTDVIVVGTRFTVDYGEGRGDVDVRVREGVVRVVHQQHETRVAAGQAWGTRSGLVASTEHDASPAPPVASAASAAGSGKRDDTMVAAGQVPDVLHDRQPAVPDAPIAGANRPTRPPAATERPRSDGVRPRVVARPSDPLVDLRTAIRAQPVEPALDVGEPDAARAVARYYEIAAHKSGHEASQAFYSIAVVNHLKLAQDSDALHWLDAYVRRFPGGKEYRDALWLRIRILCLGKIDDRCRAAAYRYLHEAPDGRAAQMAERLTLTE